MVRTPDPARREKILQAARSVLNERGYKGARMSEIAERAGVAAGTVYLYFRSKEDLVSALCEDYLSRLNQKVLVALEESDASVAIARAVRAALAHAEAQPDLVRLLNLRASLGKRHDMLPADKEMLQNLAAGAEARIETGEIRNYDPPVLAEVISGLIEWVTKACLVWGDGDISRYEETVIKLLQTALVAEKPQETGFHMPLMW